LASRRVNPSSIANPPASLPTTAGGAEFRSHRLQLPPESAGQRFDQALARSLPQYSRARIKDWIDSGLVQVDGRPLRAKDKVLGGEQVQIEVRLPVQTLGVAAEAMPVQVLHKDRALLVINKPPGLVVHPGAGNANHTLQNGLLGLDAKLALVPRAGLIHRLDKDTSGLLVIARTPEAHTALVTAMAAREITREYLAVCIGVVTAGATIDEPIGRHRTQRTRMVVRADGRPSVTHYRVLKRFRGHTLLKVTLETGRTHQIRVHLAHAGFPVVGDPVYGGRRRLVANATPRLEKQLRGFTRQALHAARLKLIHPTTGEELAWEAPLPADMQQLVNALDADCA
jgi:23S rRNA pseudouridine1911/1915/1917 synthase